MRTFLKTLSLFISSIIFFGCAHVGADKTKFKEDAFYGSWQCNIYQKDDGVEINIDSTVDYVRNGKANSIGTMMFKVSDMPSLEYLIAASSNWEINGGYLIETLTDIKLTNLSHPEFDEVFNLGSMFPKNISHSSKILVIDDSLLKIQSELDSSVYSCYKVK